MKRLKVLLFVITFMVGCLLPISAFAVANVNISGSDRYSTSYAAYQQAWGSTVPSGLVIATGDNYPDALGGAPLAALKNYGFLLVPGSTISGSGVYSVIYNNYIANVIIVGSSAAVSNTVVNEINSLSYSRHGAYPSITRIQGADRFATEANLVTSYSGWGNTAIVVNGMNYPDALSIGPLAYKFKYPLIFVCEDGSLPAVSQNAISAKGFSKILIIGSTAAVSTTTENTLKSMVGTANVTRLGGATRYNTSALCATYMVSRGMSVGSIGFSTGENFPDALSAAQVLGKCNAPLLLVATSTNVAQNWLDYKRGLVANYYWLGGLSAIPSTLRLSLTTAVAGNSYLTGWDLLSNWHLYWYSYSIFDSAVANGANKWNNYRPGTLIRVNSPSSASVTIIDDTTNAPWVGLTSLDDRCIYLNKDYMTRNNSVEIIYENINIVIHEFGHAMGLNHHTVTGNVMYYINSTLTTLGCHDKASLNVYFNGH